MLIPLILLAVILALLGLFTVAKWLLIIAVIVLIVGVVAGRPR